MKDLPYGCGDLSHTTFHAVFNMLLLLVVLTSNVFKAYRLLKPHKALGLAYWYLLLGVLFNISQFCVAVQGSWGIYPTILCLQFAASLGLAGLNPLLVLLMPLIILICSHAIFESASKHASHGPAQNSERAITEDRGSPDIPTTSSRTRLAGHTLILLFVLTLLIPTIVGFILVHTSAASDMLGLVVYLRFITYLQLIILPLLAIGQFIPQFLLIWRERQNLKTFPLDIQVLLLDAIVFTLVGISWHQLLIETIPVHANFWYGLTHLLSFQHWGLCLWSGYVLFGVGQGLVVLFYICLRHWYSPSTVDGKAHLEASGSDEASENTALLGKAISASPIPV